MIVTASVEAPPLALFSLDNLFIGKGTFILAGVLESISVGLGTSVTAVAQTMTTHAMPTSFLSPLLLVTP